MIAFREKPELQLRVSVTDRCQLRCQYCMPAGGVTWQPREAILRFEDIAAFVQILQRDFEVRKVRITGGEPLLRPGLPTLVRLLADLGIRDLALTTNGQLLTELAAPLRDAGLRRVNVSLDSLDPETFRRFSGGGDVRRTVAGIDAARRAGLTPIKLNTVVARGWNDAESASLLHFAIERGCEPRFLELMPVGYGAWLHAGAFVSAATVRELLAAQFRLDPLPAEPSASARRYRARRADGAEVVVGFIAPCSNPFCDGCRRLRLTADGRLIGCLAREGGVAVRPTLRKDGDGTALLRLVESAMRGKRSDETFSQSGAMAAIGG